MKLTTFVVSWRTRSWSVCTGPLHWRNERYKRKKEMGEKENEKKKKIEMKRKNWFFSNSHRKSSTKCWSTGASFPSYKRKQWRTLLHSRAKAFAKRKSIIRRRRKCQQRQTEEKRCLPAESREHTNWSIRGWKRERCPQRTHQERNQRTELNVKKKNKQEMRPN